VEKKWFWKAGFTLLLLLLGLFFSISSLVPVPDEKGKSDPLPSWMRDMVNGINLGLDLQGGLRLVYEVEVDEAVADKRDRMATGFVSELKRRDIENASWKPVGNDTFDLTAANAKDADAVSDVLNDYRRVLVKTGGSVGKTIRLKMVDEEKTFIRDQSVRQAQETISNRIDELGLANTTVSRRDIDIIVEVPGVEEKQTARIKRIISQTARLEFKIVEDEISGDFFRKLSTKLPEDKSITLESEAIRGPEGPVRSYFLKAMNTEERSGRQVLKMFLKKNAEIPSDISIGYQELRDLDSQGNPTTEVSWRTFYLQRQAGVTGEYIDNAYVTNDQTTGKPYVAISFNRQGAGIFEDLTGANVARRMAIQLDDKVNSAPVIQEKIGGGSARITLGGYKSYDSMLIEARDLVVVLRAGALPAPIRPVTESVIGPLLGADSIRMGKIAMAIGSILVILFMIVYYRVAGISADIALVLNIVLITGILALLGATLTLPGIAGIILTVGMAVDANVIIYERVREELRAGKAPRSAIDAGFGRAFWTIFDAQITTFIAGVVLMQYGTGAIKGFAVTLLVGIVTSMFTAIFVSRLLLEFVTRRGKAETLSI